MPFSGQSIQMNGAKARAASTRPAAEDEAAFAFVTYERMQLTPNCAPVERVITARCKGQCAPL